MTQIKTDDDAPKLIATRHISHPVRFNSGPRIEREEDYKTPDGTLITVRYWYEAGRLVRVA